MNIYFYVKTGHNVGLDALRRSVVIFNKLKQCNPILCTSDYRAATFARNFGINKGIGIDIIGNLPNLMERRDMLIFDSDEPSKIMKSFMNDYCDALYEVGVDIPKTIVDDRFFVKGDQSIQKTFFFGDDDYQDLLLKKLTLDETKHAISLLMGHYFFMGNEDKLIPYFQNIVEEEDYFNTILNTKFLLSSSINAIFESLAAGNYPIFYQREDKDTKDLWLLQEYSIPVIKGDKLTEIMDNFNKIIQNYPQTKELIKVDISDIEKNITNILKKFEAVLPSLEINY
jgi:hypothetical protein